MYNHRSYESLFNKYRDDSAIIRNEAYARWSLPTIFADLDVRKDGKQQSVRRDFQSIGAVLVNQLASKIASILFPSNQSFFRIDSTVSTDQVASAMAVSADELASGLADLENEAYRRVFLADTYSQLNMAMKLLIVTGNCLLYRDGANQRILAYGMRSYVVRRDGTGKVWEIILKERISKEDVPEGMAPLFKDREPDDDLCLYTRVKREKRSITDVFEITQEIESHRVPGAPEVFPEAICPYIPVCWNLLTGENMGRGLVEDYAGDFAKLSELSENLALYEIEASRVLHFAMSGSGVDIDTVAQTESGGWVAGNPANILAYEAGDYNKIQAMLADIGQIQQRLAPAFMYGQNIRDAERVTAEEIRQVADEANQALGGVYSSISASLHIPLANLLCFEVNPEFIQELIRGGIKLSVVTGVAALGRSSDVNRLAQAAQIIAVVVPTFAQVSQAYSPEKITRKILEGFGLKSEDFERSQEELQQLQQQAAQPVDASTGALAVQAQQSGVV